jgi:hypothetical protein
MRRLRDVAQLIRTRLESSFGPEAHTKLMVDRSSGAMSITADGLSILRIICQQPSTDVLAKLFLQLAEAHKQSTGDGTTAAVLFACCLHEQACRLIDLGAHPKAIVDALSLQSEIIQQTYVELSQPIDCIDNGLRQLIVSQLITKLSDLHAGLICDLLLAHRENLHLMTIRAAGHGSFTQSCIQDGYCFSVPSGSNAFHMQVSLLKPCIRVLLIDGYPFDTAIASAQGAISAKSLGLQPHIVTSAQSINEDRRIATEEAALSVDVVLSTSHLRPPSNTSALYISHVPKRDLYRLAQLTGCTVYRFLPASDDLDVVSASSFRVHRHELSMSVPVGPHRLLTFDIFAPSTEASADYEHVLSDAVRCVQQMPRVLVGAGQTERALAATVKKQPSLVSDCLSRAFLSVASLLPDNESSPTVVWDALPSRLNGTLAAITLVCTLLRVDHIMEDKPPETREHKRR